MNEKIVICRVPKDGATELELAAPSVVKIGSFDATTVSVPRRAARDLQVNSYIVAEIVYDDNDVRAKIPTVRRVVSGPFFQKDLVQIGIVHYENKNDLLEILDAFETSPDFDKMVDADPIVAFSGEMQDVLIVYSHIIEHGGILMELEDSDAKITGAISKAKKKLSINNVTVDLDGDYSLSKDRRVSLPEGHDFLVPADLSVIFETIAPTCFERNEVLIVQLKGDPGNGKTTMAKALASHCGVGITKIECGTIDEVSQFFGPIRAEEGRTFYEPSPFIEALANGNQVILIDEFNRADGFLFGAIMNLLDEVGTTTYENHKIVRSDVSGMGGLVIFLTANEGTQFLVSEVDEAVLSRVHVTYHITRPDDSELKNIVKTRFDISRGGGAIAPSVINDLIRILNKFDEKSIDRGASPFSIRDVIYLTRLLNLGMPLVDALTMGFVNRIPESEQKPYRDILLTL